MHRIDENIRKCLNSDGIDGNHRDGEGAHDVVGKTECTDKVKPDFPLCN